jgi:hypothetical protein
MASSHSKYSAVIKLATFYKETRDGKILLNKDIRQRQGTELHI